MSVILDNSYILAFTQIEGCIRVHTCVGKVGALANAAGLLKFSGCLLSLLLRLNEDNSPTTVL